MKRRKRTIQALSLCGALLLTGFLLWRWLLTVQPQVSRLSDGATLSLIGVTYGRHHELTTSPPHSPGLWASLRALLAPQEKSRFETPTDALILWVRVDGGKNHGLYFDFNSRIEVSDEAGNRQVIENDNYPLGIRIVAAGPRPLVIPTFPRRGKNLTVRFYRLHETYSQPDAVFHIANPASGNYPHWTPEPIPATQTSGDLKVTLAGVSPSDQAMQGNIIHNAMGFGGSYGLGPKKKPWGQLFFGEDRRVDARLQLQGKPWAKWGVARLWISDATGNMWEGSSEGGATYGMPNWNFTYLTPPNNETLRYTVECNSGTAAPFPVRDLWTVAPISVPGAKQRTPVGLSHTDGDVTLKLLGITGIGATWAKPPQSGAQPRQDRPVVYVEVTGACRPYLSATDENGKRIQGGGGQNVSDRWLQPDNAEFDLVGDQLSWPHLDYGPDQGTRILTYVLQVPKGVNRLNLVFAINKTRTFQFTLQANTGLSGR